MSKYNSGLKYLNIGVTSAQKRHLDDIVKKHNKTKPNERITLQKLVLDAIKEKYFSDLPEQNKD